MQTWYKKSCVKIPDMAFNVVFMGSPEFALPVLRALITQYLIIGVVTQPDKPAGRGQVMTPPPVKKLAIELNLPYIQPRRLREPEAKDQLKAWNPDLIVVAAFGQILRLEVLDLPRFGCINVHASLLPRWRGAAPIQAAIVNGDPFTGVTIMRMDPGVDTGPILSQHQIPIDPEDTTGTLSERLSVLGAELLLDTLPGYIRGELDPQPQDETLALRAPMLKKEDGELDFNQPAAVLERKVRAFNPWPGAFTYWQGELFKVHRAQVHDYENAVPGKSYRIDQWPAYGTAQGLLILDEVQPAGRKSMPGELFLRGARDWGN